MTTQNMVRIGDRLRRARLAGGWTLHEVEARTGGEFKASALGAYERGDRALSAVRLIRLAEVYRVSTDEIVGDVTEIDLTTLHAEEAPENTERWAEPTVLAALARFSAYIRSVRRMPAREPVRVRQSDCELMAILFGADNASVNGMLKTVGLDTKQPAAAPLQ